MKDYKYNNLIVIISVMNSKNWVGIIKRIWTIISTIIPIIKISSCITRGSQEIHSGYMRNNRQGD